MSGLSVSGLLLLTRTPWTDAFVVCGGTSISARTSSGGPIACYRADHNPILRPLALSSVSEIHAINNNDDDAETASIDLRPYGTPQELCEALQGGPVPVAEQLRSELCRIGLRDDDIIVTGDDNESLDLAKRLFMTKFLPMEDIPEKYLAVSSSYSSSSPESSGELSGDAVVAQTDSPTSHDNVGGTIESVEEDLDMEMLESVAAEIKRLEEALISKMEDEEEISGAAEGDAQDTADQVNQDLEADQIVPDQIEAEKKAYMERMLEAKRLAELAEDEKVAVVMTADNDAKVTAEEEKLEAELLSLEVQLEAERQRLDQVRMEVEHLSLMDDEEKINLPSEVPSEPQMYPAKADETREIDDSVDVRARIANSYNRYSRLDQQGALNQPNNARKEEVEHRLESQQRAVRRLAELNSPEYQRLAQRYNRYARLDDVTARLDELVAAEEDKNEEVKTMPSKDAPMDEIAERGTTDIGARQQKASEVQQQKQPPQDGSIRAPPRRAGPGLATTESFREQRQWENQQNDDLDMLDGGWQKLEIAWRVSARQFFGNEKRRLDSLGVSAFDHSFILQLHLEDESKVECELRVADVNADIVIRNANVFVYCIDDAGNRVEAHATDIENGGKDKTLFASDSDADVATVSFGRCPFNTTPGDGGGRVEVSRQRLLEQAVKNGLRVHASFDVNTVEQVTSRIFAVS